jgi:lysophospholipase L1-like esterase
MKFMTRCIVACCLAAVAFSALDAVPLRVLAIGDSMTEEYAFELPFSAPDSNPTNANVDNWPDILTNHRAAWLTLGSYRSTVLGWPDLRDGGYEYNYGVPTFTTADWAAVCQSTIFNPAYFLTKNALIDNIAQVNAVILFLGGNDLKSNYTGIYSDAQPPALLAQVVTNLATIHDFVRGHAAPDLKIIIATVPDIGATPEVAGKYTDPTLRLQARTRIATMNAALSAMAVAHGAYVARIDTLTDRVFDQVPFQLNGTNFIYHLAASSHRPHPCGPRRRLGGFPGCCQQHILPGGGHPKALSTPDLSVCEASPNCQGASAVRHRGRVAGVGILRP